MLLLKNDEHITTALETDILSRAFAILHMLSMADHPLIYTTAAACTVECEEWDHSDCQAKHSAQMLEAIYLERARDDLNAKAKNDGVSAVETEPYIFDIDLDYFHAHSSRHGDLLPARAERCRDHHRDGPDVRGIVP